MSETRVQAAPAGTASVHVEKEEVHVGVFRRLFRRARALIAAYRDAVVAATRNAWRGIKNLFRRVSETAAGKAVLSGLGMSYAAQLAIGSARYLAYSVGAGAAYMLSQVAAVGFVVLGSGYFLHFGSTFINALSAQPKLATSEVV